MTNDSSDVERRDLLHGFIVHSYLRSVGTGSQICLVGRLSNLSTFAVVINDVRHRFFIRESDAGRARACIADERVTLAPSPYRAMGGETCIVLETRSAGAHTSAARALARAQIRTYEADVKPVEAFLMDRGIHGSFAVRGAWTAGSHVARIYKDPEILPADWEPRLAVASIDIETNPSGPEIYTIATHLSDPDGVVTEEVFLFQPAKPRTRPRADGDENPFPTILRFDSERSMLAAWSARLLELDPDIITGWNVIDFDLARIVERLRELRLPFRLGRSEEIGSFLPGEARKPTTVVIAGRQVLDAMRLMRSGPKRFADQSLETAAQEILGRGKALRTTTRSKKLEEIERMHREDDEALCRYCLEDARLVAQILDKTGLVTLTLRRSLLIGIPLARAWTSIAAFDFIYIEAMHRRSIVAPTLGVDRLPLDEAPGGAIIDPASGLYENVLVFDFKSLYPSIMRTFNIDPLGFRGRRRERAVVPANGRTGEELIVAPNGACFSREAAILPDILERFFVSREEAKHCGDAVAAYVYKILLNSFYGVLGASGCRFAGSDLAGAITSFGHEILFWCRDFLAAEGYETLYGDTDSLFVRSGIEAGATRDELRARAESICSEVNSNLALHIRDRYAVQSRLELQFEKVYARFFIPPLRGSSERGDRPGARGDTTEERGTATRAGGRSKGYAGYLIDDERSVGAGDVARQRGRIEIRGMEAVRRDWTEAARELQVSLLRMIFEGETPGKIEAYVREYVRSLRQGLLDGKLVYTKALRKRVGEYKKGQPPHVQAARRLAADEQAGLIDFVWTLDGPQPTSAVSSPIDHEHYVQKQVRPIAGSFSDVLGMDLEGIVRAGGQLSLF